MKCLKCNKDMELRRFICLKDNKPFSERFIYECSNCGVLELPKPNIKENYDNTALKLFIESGRLLDKEALDYLNKQNYAYVLYLCNQLIKKFPDKQLITIQEIKSQSQRGLSQGGFFIMKLQTKNLLSLGYFIERRTKCKLNYLKL